MLRNFWHNHTSQPCAPLAAGVPGAPRWPYVALRLAYPVPSTPVGCLLGAPNGETPPRTSKLARPFRLMGAPRIATDLKLQDLCQICCLSSDANLIVYLTQWLLVGTRE